MHRIITIIIAITFSLSISALGLTDQFGDSYFAVTPEPYRPPHSVVVCVRHVPSFHYYVPDYQGNVRLVVDGNGTIEQRNDYYAYGGPWGDNAINQGFQPFKYNGKELDRMHGLDWYDYGARMYDPAMGLFTQVDPLAEQYPHLNPYQYCAGNPVKYVDPDGEKVIFINGKIGGGSPKAGSAYWNGWNSKFVMNAKKFFNDNKITFTEKDYGYLSPASHRVKAGYDYAKAHYKQWKINMSEDETFKLVSHSMGGAFSKGIENYLKDQNDIVEYSVMINTYQVDRIKNPKTISVPLKLGRVKY